MIRLTYAEWGAPEYRAFRHALAPRRADGPVETLVSSLSARLRGGLLLPVNRGRTALGLALACFHDDYPERSEVLVPAYICPSVVEAIHSVGLVPVPVDVKDDLNLDVAALRAALSHRTLALVAAHMYGCPADIADIERLCRDRGIPLIDDAAQVIGVDAAGRPLGTFGDAGILSFSQSKTLAAGAENAGGMLIVNNPRYQERLRRRWQELPAGKGQVLDLLRFLWEYRWEALTERPSYYIEKAMRRLGIARTKVIGRSKMTPLTAALASVQLASLSSRIAGRTRVIERYQRNLGGSPLVTVPQYAEGRYLTRLMVLLPPSVTRAAIRRRLKAAGIQTRRGYAALVAEGKGSSKRAAEWAPRLVELPSHSRMADATVDRVCQAVLDAVATEAGLRRQRATPSPSGASAVAPPLATAAPVRELSPSGDR